MIPRRDELFSKKKLVGKIIRDIIKGKYKFDEVQKFNASFDSYIDKYIKRIINEEQSFFDEF